MRMSAHFPYVERDPMHPELSRMPFAPIQLSANGQTLVVSALLDTGASLNVLPYGLGQQLGFVWERQTTTLRLGGNLAHREARAVAVNMTLASFPPILLAFARTREPNAPVLLGQVNFFQEFEVCFYRAQNIFGITTRQTP